MKSNNLIEKYSRQLSNVYDSREARNIVETLLLDAHGLSKTSILLNEIPNIDLEIFQKQIERLEAQEPVQFVTGVSHFYGRVFRVTEDVLIPRPETEELVRWILDENHFKTPVIWDVGTGSGCIALTLAAELEDSEVYAIDVSSEALQVVDANSKQLGTKTVQIQHDIMKGAPDICSPHIIVSNPPYIPISEKNQMSKNVLDFEPELALFVEDADPLLFYRKIAEIGNRRMKQGGFLYFEIHESFGGKVCDLLEGLGYADVELKHDMQGKDRMVRGRLNQAQIST